MTIEHRRRAVWGGLILLGLVTGFVASAQHVAGFKLPAWGALALLVLVVPAAGYLTLRWWRLLDEVAQEAHKFAWYWGGSGGMAVGGVLLCMATLPQAGTIHIPSWLDGRTDPAAYAATGAFGMMLLMLIGYTVVWAWWWITRMRD